MYKAPPLHSTDLTPKEIIGFENMSLFVAFYKEAHNNGGEFPEGRIAKKFSKEDRGAITSTLHALRCHGFYPGGFDQKGQIRWMVALKSDCQVEMEKGLRPLLGKTLDQCREIVKASKQIFTEIV